jgi:ABC-type nitrate/sulfonate/bicarbonate transport system permease component
MRVYPTRRHLAVMFAFLATPFLFLLFFSRIAGIGTVALFRDIGVSSLRLAIAYLIAASLGWLFAVLFSRGKRATVALPFFDVLQSFPTFAALPLAVSFWGASSSTVIFFLVITIIWPIFFSIVSSLKLVRQDWEEAVEMSGVRGMTYVRKFLLPVSIPGLVTGTVVGLGEGWEALVATEIVTRISTGLGSFFEQFSSNPGVTAFGILGLLLLIFSVNKLLWLPLLDRSHRMMED